MTHAVVVGSGIAGLMTALHAAGAGVDVTLVTKDELEHANTRYAQGGIAGVMFGDDRVEDHVHDTIVAGAGLSDPAAVRVLAEEGPERIRELISLGVGFDRDDGGELVRGLEAAHSYPRILHAGGDATGTEIERALVAAVRDAGIAIIEHAFLVDLIVEAGAVRGVELLEAGRGRVILIADAVVLATGGAGQLYNRTTNPAVATGDGIAAALRAGAEVADLEFVQFHPTVLAVGEPFLVSEAVRGEGGVLVDDSGLRFMLDVHPDAELAPRDVVARAIAARMAAQGGRPVRLDATAIGGGAAGPETAEAFLARRFPTIDAAVRARGLDWSREPIPVTPAAHYLMGGVVTDLDGRTSIPGLYAVGEVARTGVHGANRLASNSLLEGAVFAARAAAALASAGASGSTPWQGPRTLPAPLVAAVHAAEAGGIVEPVAVPFSRSALQRLMWDHAGLERTGARLSSAAAVVAGWRAQERTPQSVHELEDENLLDVAAATIRAALARTESVGAHHRIDTPEATPTGTPRLAPDAAASRTLTGALVC